MSLARASLLFILIAATLAPPFAGRDAVEAAYFVSPTGDDAASGLSIEEPRRTIKTTLAWLAPEDTLNLLGGTYDATSQGAANMVGFQLPADGVLIRGWPGAVATIDWAGVELETGQRFLNGWNDVSNGEIRALRFVNWSNDTFFIYDLACDSLAIRDCVFDGVSPTNGNPIILVRGVRGVSITGCAFRGRSAASRYYAVALRGDESEAPEGYLVEDCTFNSEAALAADTLGWSAGVVATHVDGLVVRGCSGFNAGHDVDMNGRGEHFVGLFDADDVLLEDLHFKRYLGGRTQSSWVHNANGIEVAAATEDDRSERVRIESCELWGAGHGIEVGNTSNEVHIAHVWCDSTYDDCIFFDDGSSNSSARFVVSHHSQDNGIDFQGTGITVSQCTIVRPENAALNVTGLASSVDISSVLVYDVRDPLGSDEILFLGEEADDISIDYCLYFDPDGQQTRFRVDDDHLTFTEWQQLGYDANGIWGDPRFCDAGGRAWPLLNDAFRLRPGSPAEHSGRGGVSMGALEGGCGLVDVATATVTARPLVRLRRNPVRQGFELFVTDAAIRRVTVEIFDAGGRRLGRSEIAAADGRLEIPAIDVTGRALPSGVYFLSVRGQRWRRELRSVLVR